MRVRVSAAAPAALSWIEQGLVPDSVVRAGIRRLCNVRLVEIEAADAEAACRRTEAFVASMDTGPIAPLPWLANEQHYEVPAEFFALALGPHRKYSCAYWPEGTGSLAGAEAAALAATAERAGLADGQSILELGCGWGSLTLWMAEHLPVMAAAIVTAVAVMLLAADPLSRFVNAHLSVKLLALSFLILVGMALVADGIGFHIPRGYLYFAIAFSAFVEWLNLRAAKRRRTRALRAAEADAAHSQGGSGSLY